MNSGSATSIRQQGVVTNSPQDDTRAPAKTVVHCTPVEMLAVEMGDESGRKVTTLIFNVGGTYYHDPNGEQWARQLRPIDGKSWLAQQLQQHQSATSGTVPKTDAVDVMGAAK